MPARRQRRQQLLQLQRRRHCFHSERHAPARLTRQRHLLRHQLHQHSWRQVARRQCDGVHLVPDRPLQQDVQLDDRARPAADRLFRQQLERLLQLAPLCLEEHGLEHAGPGLSWRVRRRHLRAVYGDVLEEHRVDHQHQLRQPARRHAERAGHLARDWPQLWLAARPGRHVRARRQPLPHERNCRRRQQLQQPALLHLLARLDPQRHPGARLAVMHAGDGLLHLQQRRHRRRRVVRPRHHARRMLQRHLQPQGQCQLQRAQLVLHRLLRPQLGPHLLHRVYRRHAVPQHDPVRHCRRRDGLCHHQRRQLPERHRHLCLGRRPQRHCRLPELRGQGRRHPVRPGRPLHRQHSLPALHRLLRALRRHLLHLQRQRPVRRLLQAQRQRHRHRLHRLLRPVQGLQQLRRVPVQARHRRRHPGCRPERQLLRLVQRLGAVNHPVFRQPEDGPQLQQLLHPRALPGDQHALQRRPLLGRGHLRLQLQRGHPQQRLPLCCGGLGAQQHCRCSDDWRLPHLVSLRHPHPPRRQEGARAEHQLRQARDWRHYGPPRVAPPLNEPAALRRQAGHPGQAHIPIRRVQILARDEVKQCVWCVDCVLCCGCGIECDIVIVSFVAVTTVRMRVWCVGGCTSLFAVTFADRTIMSDRVVVRASISFF
eukprot:m.195085 g.195085  ORF g.195085 m.195085 type:complete len:652 (-) comp17630_c0_seq9:196-2151(-)